MSAKRRILAVAVAAGAAATALTGCGGDGSGAAAPIVRPIATVPVDAGPYAGLTARRLLDRAETAMKAAPSLTVRMDGTRSGVPTHIRAVVTQAGRCAATMRDGSGEVQLIGTGTMYYVKAGADYWEAHGGPQGKAMARVLAGKWLSLRRKSLRGSGAGALCDITGMIDEMSAADSVGTLTKGHPTTLGGRPVIPLLHTRAGGTTILYVAAQAKPYILKWRTPGGDSPVTVTFSDFGRIPRITAPPPGRTVDLGAFGDPDDFSI